MILPNFSHHIQYRRNFFFSEYTTRSVPIFPPKTKLELSRKMFLKNKKLLSVKTERSFYFNMVRPEGIEPPACGLGKRRFYKFEKP